ANDVTRLQALVDKKKVVVTEAMIREALCLDDVEGVDCLPNEEIFAELARMGYEKPSTKLTFYNAFFSSQWNLVQQTPPQSPQVQPPSPQPQPQQAAEFPMSLLQEVMDTYATLTRRVEHLEFDQVAQALEITKLKRRRVETSDDNVMDDESNLGRMIAEIDQDDDVVLEDDKEEDRKVANAVKDVEEAKEDETEPTEVQEVVDVVTTAKLITKVVTTASETVTAAIIRDPEEESTTSTIIPAKTKSKDKGKEILVEEPKPLKKKQQIEQDEQYARELHVELNKDIDWDEAIVHVKLKAKEDHVVKKYQAMKRKPQTEAQARKNMMMYLKNVVGFKMDYFTGMSYDDIRLIFEANFNSNVAFLLKTKEEIEEDVNRALQNLNKTPAERAAKRRKLDEEVEELKRHLQIVPNEDDDVYTEATPLARKVPVVDYEIIETNNKPCYKIIRADDMEESKDCTWSSKGQRMEATKIMRCADQNFYIYSADFVSREEVSAHKIHSRPDVECCKNYGRGRE
nr:hypothetical protein [Tanacetum cinerariifolium]